LIDLVDLLEKQNKLKQAVLQLERAASYFEQENKNSQEKKLRERLALMQATVEYYDDAIEYWEERARKIVDGSEIESKLSAKNFLFKAGLCQLAQVKDIEEDLEMAADKIHEYRDLDKWLVRAAEGQFLLDAIAAFEEKDMNMFMKAMRDYDDKENLDMWTTNIFDTMSSNLKAIVDEENDLT
jgi:hypothetical protein